MWTRFMDMHSGGGQKLPWDFIVIEEEQAKAEATFQGVFGRDPYHVTCTCCGPDYSVWEMEELETEGHRWPLIISAQMLAEMRGE